MLLSENEAKFKYCPLLKTSDDKFRMCQGSQCMMWRYVSSVKTEEGDPGYCGMGGKPVGIEGRRG